jgi:PEP-CTERM motif
MEKLRTFVLPACLMALALGGTATAGTLIVGTPADSTHGNCFPFGCNYDFYVPSGQYQQVYNSSLFSGPIAITGLEFYNTQEDNGATAMNTGTFTISLSTTAADWNSLSGSAAANIGSDNTQVFSGSLVQPWAFGDVLTIAFSTPFTYSPGSGANLLLNVVATGTGQSGAGIYFDGNGYNGGGFDGNTIMGRNFGGIVNSGYGLVIGFDTDVPEPATFALIFAGLAGCALLRRKRLG